MLERRDTGMEARRKGRMKRDEGNLGFRIVICKDSGLEGYIKGGIQPRTRGIRERRDTAKGGKREKKIHDRRDAEQERCWTGGIQERWKWNAGQVGCRSGGMKKSRNAGKEGCRKGEIKEMRYANLVLKWHYSN